MRTPPNQASGYSSLLVGAEAALASLLKWPTNIIIIILSYINIGNINIDNDNTARATQARRTRETFGSLELLSSELNQFVVA